MDKKIIPWKQWVFTIPMLPFIVVWLVAEVIEDIAGKVASKCEEMIDGYVEYTRRWVVEDIP